MRGFHVKPTLLNERWKLTMISDKLELAQRANRKHRNESRLHNFACFFHDHCKRFRRTDGVQPADGPNDSCPNQLCLLERIGRRLGSLTTRFLNVTIRQLRQLGYRTANGSQKLRNSPPAVGENKILSPIDRTPGRVSRLVVELRHLVIRTEIRFRPALLPDHVPQVLEVSRNLLVTRRI